MKEKTLSVQQTCIVGAALAAALLMTGCCCPGRNDYFTACPENQRFPIITCQPMDAEADIGQKATFYVNAKGENLKYQWYYIGGGLSADPVPIPGATDSVYNIAAVVPLNHYGLYFCTVYKDAARPDLVTHSRQATLGGKASRGAGGSFAATQNPSQGSGPSTICGFSVGNKWVGFPGAQIPVSPDIGFRGNLWKIVGTTEVRINRSTYYLQWLNSNDLAQKGCCSDVISSTEEEVYACLVPGNPYLFTAYFKAGQAPPNGTTVILKGTWIPTCPPP